MYDSWIEENFIKHHIIDQKAHTHWENTSVISLLCMISLQKYYYIQRPENHARVIYGLHLESKP